jgi:hypothetical protein
MFQTRKRGSIYRHGYEYFPEGCIKLLDSNANVLRAQGRN